MQNETFNDIKVVKHSLASQIKTKAVMLASSSGTSEQYLRQVIQLCEELSVIQKAAVIMAVELDPEV